MKPNYVIMDSFYPAAKLLGTVHKLKWHWISKIKFNRLVDEIQIQDFFDYRYDNHIGRFSENINALIVKDNENYLATSDFSLTSTIVKNFSEIVKQSKNFSES